MLHLTVCILGLALCSAAPQGQFFYQPAAVQQTPLFGAITQQYQPNSYDAQYGNPYAAAAHDYSRLYSATEDDTNDAEPVAAFRHVRPKPFDPFPNDNHRFPENHPSNAYKNNRPTNYLPNYYNYASRNPTNYLYGSYYYPSGVGPYPNTNPYHWYGGYASSYGYNRGGGFGGNGGYGGYGNGYGYGYGSPDGSQYNTGSYLHKNYKNAGFGENAGAEEDAALHSNMYE